ncbi:MAG: HAMP domain-containing sensor histidine kinase [Candidatus Peregrinibacteria bacterium]
MLSTRVRIAFFFAILVFLLLGGSSALLIASYHYSWIQNETLEMEKTDQRLMLKIQEKQREKNFDLQKELKDFFDDEDHIIGKVLDPFGTVIFTSDGFPNIQTFPEEGQTLLLSNEKLFLRTDRLSKEGEIVFFLEDVSDYWAQEENLIQKALFLSGASSIFLFFLGYFFAWRILTPLRRIAQKAKEISISSLHTRLPLSGNQNDEIRILSHTLNDLLGRLEQSAENLRQFTQDASHELRTPLTIIDSSLQLALKTKNFEHIETARAEISTMQQLIDALLILAKNDRQVFLLSEKKIIVLQDLLDDIFQHISQKLAEKNISWNSHIPEGISFFFEPESFRRILWNLLWNAYKFTPENGSITLEYASGVLRISNSGTGILEKDIPYIFERFFRSESVRGIEGVGLGLAITKSLVEANGWKITAKNGKNGGAVFEIHREPKFQFEVQQGKQ